MTLRVICFGAANVDIQARAEGPVVPGSSNPVRTERRLGGVARNVAAWLAMLDAEVVLVCRLGEDPDGDRILTDLRSRGVDCRFVTRSSTSPTASYTAVLDPDGEMHIGLADMAIHEEISGRVLDDALETAGDADAWFADANLPAESLRHLAGCLPAGTFLAADTVSVAKAPRLLGILNRLDLLTTNTVEAGTLTNHGPPERMAMALLARGVAEVAVARGAEGGLLAGAGAVVAEAAMARRVADVTGAGDALAAGLLHARLTGQSSETALRIGMAAAAMAVESPEPLPETVTRSALLDRASAGL